MDDLTFNDLQLLQDDAGYGFSGSAGANMGYTAPASTNPMDNQTNLTKADKNRSGRRQRLGNRFGAKGKK